MSVSAELHMIFPSALKGKRFRKRLEPHGIEAELYGTFMEVTDFAHGDRVMVMEKTRQRGAEIIMDEVYSDGRA